MSLQRSLQNGRKGESFDHSMSRPQVGHLTVAATTASEAQGSGRRGARPSNRYEQQHSMKRTSPSACVGRAVSPFQVRKRMLQR
jgi:hypothetical protein